MQVKKTVSILRGSCFALITLALVSCGGVDDQQSVEAAKQYIEQNKLREAGLELRNALQENASNAEARYLLGELNLTIGDMASAAKDFRKAGEAGWDKAQSELGIMRALVAGHQFKKALDTVRVDDAYPDKVNADIYGLSAFAQAAMGDIDAAKASIEKGRALDADAFHILKTTIQLELTSGNFDAAEKLIERSHSVYGENAEIMMLSAYGAQQNKQNEKAVMLFNKVVAKEPKGTVTFIGRSARLGLARMEISNKNYDTVRDLLKPLFKQSPDDPETNYIGALYAFEKGAYNLAEERILKVFKNVPNHAKTQLLYGTVHFAKKDYEQAAYYIGKYLQQIPQNIGARKLLGRTYILLGQHEEARKTLQSATPGSENDAELLALVGLSQLQSGDLASGITGLEAAVGAAPENVELRSELAKAYISAGETERAIKQLNELLEEGGDKNKTQVLMVSAHLRAQQYNEAINVALEMLERSPDDAATLSLVGNVFAASGDKQEARKYFNKALSQDPKYSLALMLLAAMEESDENFDAAEKLYRQSIGQSADVNAYLALARLASLRGDNDGMLEWLEKARSQDDADLRSRLILSEYYMRERDLVAVEAIVAEVKEIAPADPRVLTLQGRLAMLLQRYNEALTPLNKLVAAEPKAIVSRVLLGESYLRLKQYDDARKQADAALALDEFDASALILLASIDLAAGNYRESVLNSQKVQKMNPDFSLAFEAEGDARLAMKQFKEAAAVYETAMRLKPSSSLAVKLSGSMLEAGRNEQAKSSLQQWLQQHPEDVGVHQYLGTIYQSLGENAAAIKSFETVLKSQPENIVSLNNLAWLYSLEDDPKAVAMAEKAYKQVPENPGVLDTYGWVLVKNGQVDKGRQILEQALKGLPDDADVQYHYAVALSKTGEKAEAKKRLARLLKSGQSFEDEQEAKTLHDSLP